MTAMAFYHEDGNVPAWRFALEYAGKDGHIATLPEIIEARLATELYELPWKRYFTTNSAEYYGLGADGTEKLIVAHGVGPMSTLDGMMKAYAWQYKDKQRNNRGGRVTAEEFLKLEAGEYGNVAVLDFRSYMESWSSAFYTWHNGYSGLSDALLTARLGPRVSAYLGVHAGHALAWHLLKGVELPRSLTPYLMQNRGASNCPYDYCSGPDWWHRVPRPLENGKAVGHLLSISSLETIHASDETGHWRGLVSQVSCHEWSSGARFVGVPDGSSYEVGIAEAPSPGGVIRTQWQRFMQANHDDPYVPPRLYLLEQAESGWFTRYPKDADGALMDDGDVEFMVRSVRVVGQEREFKVDGNFFLRYNLAQVVAIAPEGANAYKIVDISTKDVYGLTTVTVRFYKADVDTSQRLPRSKLIKQNYRLLMG